MSAERVNAERLALLIEEIDIRGLLGQDRDREIKRVRRAADICQSCLRDTVPGSSRCEYHRAKNAAAELRRQQGLRGEVDRVLGWVRRMRSDANDRGARDHVREGASVRNRQRPAMDTAGIEPGRPHEFKHSAVHPSEFAGFIGGQLLRREAGEAEWPLVMEEDSPIVRSTCGRYGIDVEVLA